MTNCFTLFFELLGSVGVKAAYKMLVKLIPGAILSYPNIEVILKKLVIKRPKYAVVLNV